MASNAPPLSASVLSAKSVAAAAGDDLPNGLTSDEARRRLEKFGPNAMPDTSAHPLRMALEKILGAGSVDARGRDRARAGARQVCRGRDHRRPPGVQRRARVFPGGPRPGNPCRAEVAAGADRVRPARRRVEDRARGRAGAGRRGEAVARRRGCRGCAPHRREKSCSTNPCSPANRCRSKPARACKPMPGRWCGAARRWRRSRRPARAPSSAAPRSWSAPPMS